MLEIINANILNRLSVQNNYLDLCCVCGVYSQWLFCDKQLDKPYHGKERENTTLKNDNTNTETANEAAHNDINKANINSINCTENENTDLPEDVYLRYSVQFHWFNLANGYTNFEHYLSYFNARKRKNTKKF